MTGGTIRSGNLTLTSGNLILGTNSLTQTLLSYLNTINSNVQTQINPYVHFSDAVTPSDAEASFFDN